MLILSATVKFLRMLTLFQLGSFSSVLCTADIVSITLYILQYYYCLCLVLSGSSHQINVCIVGIVPKTKIIRRATFVTVPRTDRVLK